MEYFHGREHAFDGANILKELFTLGVYKSPDEKKAPLISPEAGIFSAADFDPASWKSSFTVIPFNNMTDDDALWATRIMLSLSESELLSIVKTGEYTNPQVTEYILKTLLERRRIAASYWLSKANRLADFVIQTGSGGIALTFSDLMVDHGFASSASTQYTYQIRVNGSKAEKGTTGDPYIILDPHRGKPVEVTIWTTRDSVSSEGVKVVMQGESNGGGFNIYRIVRG
jgi:hypothetical protein